MNKSIGIWGVIICIFVIGISVTTATKNYVDNQALAELQTENSIEAAIEQPESMVESASENTISSYKANTDIRPRSGRVSPQAEAAALAEGEPAADVSVKGESGDQAKTEASIVEISPLQSAQTMNLTDESEPDDFKAYYEKRLTELDAQIQKMRAEETDSTTYSMKSAAVNEYKLWDNELNAIYAVVLEQLDEEQGKALVLEEREWIKKRDEAAMENAKKYSGGTMEGIEYTASLAATTRARAYELVNEYLPLLAEE